MYKEFIYRGKRFFYRTKREILEKLVNEFLPERKKPMNYMNFYVWQTRINPDIIWEDKLKLYFDYHITRKIIKENQVDIQTYRKKRKIEKESDRETEDISDNKVYGSFKSENWEYSPNFAN